MAELGPYSRYRLAFTVRDEVQNLTYTLIRSRRVFFDPSAENRIYKAQIGENIFSVAARHFRGYARPAALYWLLADYQPVPILDPTKDLDGMDIYIPPAEKVAAILKLDETSS